MTNCPFSKRSPRSRVVVKLNCVSVQCRTVSTRSGPMAAKVLALMETPRDGIRRAGGSWKFQGDRKSTRLNSSHDQISYAVFCLKKKKESLRAVRFQQLQLP